MKTKMMTLPLTLAATLCLALCGPAAEPRKTNPAVAKPAVTDIHYFPQSSVLRVEMANGRTYQYENVPAALADQFAVSEQKRAFYDREITPQYRTVPAKMAKEPAAPAIGKTKSATKPKAAAVKPAVKKEPAGTTGLSAAAKPKSKSPTRKGPESSGPAVPKTPAPPR